MPPSGLESFHPVTREWFAGRFKRPTEAQELAWPRIAANEHVLVSAPTGSGKTLTAFLWALDRLLSANWLGGGLRVLYVSPLKALNNDIERNLVAPLAELEAAFEQAGCDCQPVRVAVRSGDTLPSERQKMLRRPPEILITTPESLNILLTSKRGRGLFGDLETVILDEIHAVADSKRGTHLISAVDRLVPLAGSFQRLALSATVRPAAEIARFVGGYRLDYTGGEPVYSERPVAVVSSQSDKQYELEVCRPEGLESLAPEARDLRPGEPPANLWEALTADFRRRIEANRSTLLFANSRRQTEKVTRLLNESVGGRGAELAYSHHGSLSRELRSVVEERLKEGRLKAIVATNSLELGIDIGSLDEVLLVQTPPTIASAVQRIGRAGHGVGQTSRARLYPFFGRDLLQAAVMARSVLDQDIEEIRPVRAPLDVLAQIILSMTAGRPENVDEVFDRLRTSYPFRNLARAQFDLVIEMLAGRYADARIRELQPRLAFDRALGRIEARRGSERLVYMSGGTIPDRGYFQLRHHDTLGKIGELDEEFVWERNLGDTFTLGAQSWRIRKITHSDVLVSPVTKGAAFAPFWRAEERSRSFHLSERIGSFLERADEVLAQTEGARELVRILTTQHAMSSEAAAETVTFLELQRSATGVLPHRHRLLAEKLAADPIERESGRSTWVLHTGWGGRVNRPLALVLPAAYERMAGGAVEVDANNDSLLLQSGAEFEVERLLEFLARQPIETLLRERLEKSGFFGARFRENAGRALLLPRSGLKRRVPLWLQRERGKKLLAAVADYGDFPIVLETWRTCLEDMFDLEALKRVLAEFERGEVAVTTVTTDTASPFTADLMWRRTNSLMYADDTSIGREGHALSENLLREMVFSAELRPRFDDGLLAEFQAKLQRTHPGYAPRDATDLIEWVKERWIVPEGEWHELAAAIDRDRQDKTGEAVPDSVVGDASSGLAVAVWEDRTICARERLPLLVENLGRPRVVQDLVTGEELALDTAVSKDSLVGRNEIVAEWLRYYGPISEERGRSTFGFSAAQFEAVVETLRERGAIVVDRFRRQAEAIEFCDTENLERLLRIQRARRRPQIEALPLEELPLFLAHRQGLANGFSGGSGASGASGASEASDPADLKQALGLLIGFPASARLWEAEILPARLDPYYSAWLDGLFQETDLLWLGTGKEKICFGFPEEVGLVAPSTVDDEAPETVLPDPNGRFRLEEIARQTGRTMEQTALELWQAAWQGQITNSSFSALRQGAASRFRLRSGRHSPGASDDRASRPISARRSRPARRRTADRWRSSDEYRGSWYRLEREAPTELDALDQAETNKDRVRLLLDRYGVIFRELLTHELRAFRWSALFRTLRLMELSGEIVSGRFFEGIHGLQFASHDAVRRLREGLARDVVFWMSAVDSASPCGLGLEGFGRELPARIPSNHLVFRGPTIVVTSKRHGNELTIRVGADHPEIERYFGFMKNLLVRQFAPLGSVDVSSINGEPAATSAYAPVLRRIFDTTREGAALRLRRRYAPVPKAVESPVTEELSGASNQARDL